ncbi:hypothetical protein M433DRAFT_64689 [Acidomyces richmondensis BFW]|nr:MAG: hypothetical protein FE78DRAFT_144837 [Acidomyces sp. 'richmondensis']KYG46649.1 hypothetical protein M433DRAFT_64689 [Acidomyces richmondensis BFW]
MSSPLRPGASVDEELDYYKKQYEQLEADLADFQASSKELEEQLERDIEAAEKNERRLKEQVEKLTFEVEEWKTKHKQSKIEANNAQNALQREITELRETKRQVDMRLRDIEVMNDDYERKARHTESSLEDMESKYNVAIERGVMLEEEVRMGEREREALRIETQRLRDELGDLKVENEITLEKLRLADETIERLRSRKPSPFAVESLRTRSPGSEASGISPSSPTASTPPPKSDTMSDAPTPPSPPLSDSVPAQTKLEMKTPSQPKRTMHIPDAGATPRAMLYGARGVPKHSRGPSVASSSISTLSDARLMKPPTSRPSKISRTNVGEGLPRSDSLYQIKQLRGRMQKIEERVHSARSKLPAPSTRTPTGSPRAGSALGDHIPSSITVRRSSKRPSGSATSSLVNGHTVEGVSRLSYGIPRSTSSLSERPPSALDRPPSAAASRPSSRASLASTSGRPPSRSGARTADFTSTNPTAAAAGRPRSSLSGNYASVHSAPRSHRPSASVSETFRQTVTESGDAMAGSIAPATPACRTTMERVSALPTPSGLPRRQSGGIQQPKTIRQRTSTGFGSEGGSGGEMRPPPSRRKMSDVGETY